MTECSEEIDTWPKFDLDSAFGKLLVLLVSLYTALVGAESSKRSLSIVDEGVAVRCCHEADEKADLSYRVSELTTML